MSTPSYVRVNSFLGRVGLPLVLALGLGVAIWSLWLKDFSFSWTNVGLGDKTPLLGDLGPIVALVAVLVIAFVSQAVGERIYRSSLDRWPYKWLKWVFRNVFAWIIVVPAFLISVIFTENILVYFPSNMFGPGQIVVSKVFGTFPAIIFILMMRPPAAWARPFLWIGSGLRDIALRIRPGGSRF